MNETATHQPAKPRLTLANALRNYNMITGSVEAERWGKWVDEPFQVLSFTLKHTPGASIPHYTMVDVLKDGSPFGKPLGSASDQVFTDLLTLATFLNQVPGVSVEDIIGGTDVDEDTGEVFTGKRITRVVFPEGDYPVFVLRAVETKNAGREVFKVEAHDPMQPAESPGEDAPFTS